MLARPERWTGLPANRVEAHKFGTCTIVRSTIAAPSGTVRSGGRGYSVWCSSSALALTLWKAASRMTAPSYRTTMPPTPPQRATAWRAIASNTGWTSVGELEMTRRISLVAVCRANDSVSACPRLSTSAFRSSVWERVTALAVFRGPAHSSQNLAVARFSCWHRGHVIAYSHAPGAAQVWRR
jgi:hypothetical protein